jgi:AcrR family transcriptional regulator
MSKLGPQPRPSRRKPGKKGASSVHARPGRARLDNPSRGSRSQEGASADGGGARNAQSARAKRSAERRAAILAAALEEFSARGFAATRLDDVARRADVAKGTIYLHFADKETLFQELLRTELGPVVDAVTRVSHADIRLRQSAEQLIEVFARENFETRRKDVIRLVITEGTRFPVLAEFYYHEVIARVMETIRSMLRRAVERGELKSDALVRFPQLLGAPGIVAIIWSGLFDRFEPIDIRALLRAHFDVLFNSEGSP